MLVMGVILVINGVLLVTGVMVMLVMGWGNAGNGSIEGTAGNWSNAVKGSDADAHFLSI